MSLRETLNKNPGITTGVTVAVIAIAVAFIIYSQWPSRGAQVPTTAFYSSDDGKTWFEGDAKLIPPVMIDGKEAYRAHVYKCDGEKFVAYLEGYTPEAKQAIQAMQEASKNPDVKAGEMGKYQLALQHGQQFKKPGDKEWMTMMDPKFGSLMNLMCKDGKTAAQRVTP